MPETLTTVEALNRALADEMEANNRVLVLGEDVGRLGGIFRVTEGLKGRFGSERVFDTPASESGIVGVALGLAMAGFRPVVEMQFAAYVYPALEQIIDHVAKYRLRTKGKLGLPLVIRMPVGGGNGGKEHHAESPETIFVHTAGLKVLSPSGPLESYDLLAQAIRDPDPVVFLEPIRLYRKAETGELGAGHLPMHQAKLMRNGTDLTFVSYGGMVGLCVQAADALAGEGVSAQVLDLRCLSPLDIVSIRECVRSTGRAVIVHEAPLTLGLGAEISARITEECFDRLLAPVERVTGYDTPYPPPSLEERWWPTLGRIASAARRIAGYDLHD
jgi:pyruvate dehydrogenase E1 component beta subunit